MTDKIAPIFITDNDTGEKYELDFNRETIYLMDKNGFAVDEETLRFPSNFKKLFRYAMRKNHRKVPDTKIDALYQKMGGLTDKMIERLIQLYWQTAAANNIQEQEELDENPRVTVEL